MSQAEKSKKTTVDRLAKLPKAIKFLFKNQAYFTDYSVERHEDNRGTWFRVDDFLEAKHFQEQKFMAEDFEKVLCGNTIEEINNNNHILLTTFDGYRVVLWQTDPEKMMLELQRKLSLVNVQQNFVTTSALQDTIREVKSAEIESALKQSKNISEPDENKHTSNENETRTDNTSARTAESTGTEKDQNADTNTATKKSKKSDKMQGKGPGKRSQTSESAALLISDKANEAEKPMDWKNGNQPEAGGELSMSTGDGEDDDTPECWEDVRKGKKKKQNVSDVSSSTSNRNKNKQASTSPAKGTSPAKVRSPTELASAPKGKKNKSDKEDAKSLQKNEGNGKENKQASELQVAPNNKVDTTKCAPSTNHSIAKSNATAEAEEEEEEDGDADANTGQTTGKKRVKNVKPGEISDKIMKILTFLFFKGGIKEKKLALEPDESLSMSAILSIDSVQGKFTEEQIRTAVEGHNHLFQLVSCDGTYFVKDIPQRKKPDSREAAAATSKGVQQQDSDNNWSRKSYNGPRESDADVHLSKTMAFMLRHGAERSHLRIESDGYMYVEEILHSRSLYSYSYTEQDVERVVSNNAKKRFNLIKDEKTGKLKVRANQGHTLEVKDLELTPIINSLDEESAIVHGTNFEVVQQIKRKGLSRMKRNHIHFARSEPGSSGVISGMREDCEIAIYVDMQAAIKDGFKFFRSANDVILCAGDEHGYLPPKYITKIINRRTNDNQQPSAWSSKQAAETRLAKELRVKAAFNHKYRQSHGRLHVPYAKIERGQRIAVTGMPAGILFRNPSKMTVAELDRVLATMDGISFCAVSSEGTAAVSTSGSTTCVSTSGSMTSSLDEQYLAFIARNRDLFNRPKITI